MQRYERIGRNIIVSPLIHLDDAADDVLISVGVVVLVVSVAGYCYLPSVAVVAV